MALSDSDLVKIGSLMDERLMKFHEEVTEPMVNNIYDRIHEETLEMETRLNSKITTVENNTYRIEKKLDNISDHHSEKIDDHEKRIVRPEKSVSVSL